MRKTASKLLEQIGDYAKSNPGLIAAILAGGGAAGLAGGVAASGKKDPDESRGSRRLRILRNALLTGAAGAGAVGAGALAMNRLGNALPSDDVDPATGLFGSAAGRGLMGGTLGFIGHTASNHKRENAAAGLLRASGIQDTSKGSARDTIRNILNTGGEGSGDNKRLFDSLNSNPVATRKGLIASGLDEHALKFVQPDLDTLPGSDAKYRLSSRLGGVGRKWQAFSDAAGDKLMKAVADKPRLSSGLSQLGDFRRTVSRAAYRQPGTAALVGAGLMAPEVLSAVGSLARPLSSNPFQD